MDIRAQFGLIELEEVEQNHPYYCRKDPGIAVVQRFGRTVATEAVAAQPTNECNKADPEAVNSHTKTPTFTIAVNQKT